MKPTQLKVTFKEQILSDSICCSEDGYDFFLKIWDNSLINIQEQVYIIYLNGANQVTCWRCFNTGVCSETLFDIKFALACCITCLAPKMIIAHNHPSGILRPSKADIVITERLRQACTIMDITLEDHFIISRKGYFSFVDNGLLKG